jgi:hypothetical protein
MSLNLGSEGYINMEIVAFDTDVLASDSTKTAPITWVSEQVLKTDHRMNPGLVTNYKYESNPSFKRSSTSTSNSGYSQWNTQNAYTANNTAKITFNVTAVTDGILRLKYITGASNGYTASLKVDGIEIINGYSTAAQDYDLTIVNGTSYVIEYEVTTKNNTSSTTTYIKLCDTSNRGHKSYVDALITQSSVTIENCLVRVIDDYVTGTGTIGGYVASEMRDYIQNTIKPLIPSDVRSHIVPVTKYTKNINTTGAGVNNVESTEDVWLLSYREVSNLNETTGPYYSTAFPDSASCIKYKSGSPVSWWMRSARDTDNFFYMGKNGTGASSYGTGRYGVVIGFCT